MLALIAACGEREPDAATPCGHIAAQLASCEPVAPAKMRFAFRETCSMYESYRPRPEDGSDNMALDAKRAIDTCAKAATCADLKKCFDEQRCEWVLTSPTADPQFSCFGPPK